MVFYPQCIVFHKKILPPKSIPSSSFDALDCALCSLGISDTQRNSIYGLMASILHLGNIKFEKNDLGYAQICTESNPSLEFVADILETNSKQLEKVFLERSLSIPNNQSNFVV